MDDPAKTAEEQLAQEEDDVAAATKLVTERLSEEARLIGLRSRPTPGVIQNSAGSGSGTTSRGSGSMSPHSKNSVGHWPASKMRWSKPKNVRGFAAQANDVATRVLNGEIDLETARVYASTARVVAQSMSIEVTRARFLKELPDLSLEVDDEN